MKGKAGQHEGSGDPKWKTAKRKRGGEGGWYKKGREKALKINLLLWIKPVKN